ncbi:MAG TPA: hypothetical protein VIJ00_08030, partial [Nakamurella sp.]
MHDYDNKHGLRVLSGGKKAKVFGDHHLREGDTEKIAIAAVRGWVGCRGWIWLGRFLGWESVGAGWRLTFLASQVFA